MNRERLQKEQKKLTASKEDLKKRQKELKSIDQMSVPIEFRELLHPK